MYLNKWLCLGVNPVQDDLHSQPTVQNTKMVNNEVTDTDAVLKFGVVVAESQSQHILQVLHIKLRFLLKLLDFTFSTLCESYKNISWTNGYIY